MSARTRASRRRRPLVALLLGATGIAASLMLVSAGSTTAAPTTEPTHPVLAFGAARDLGGPPQAAGRVAALAATPGGLGYWVVTTAGHVHGFGEAPWLGSADAAAHGATVVDIVSSRTGAGYWVATTDGKVLPFGDAASFGSLDGQALNRPIVAMAATPSGRGYWLVATDGGVFAFGDARFHGSTGGTTLNSPMVGIAGAPDGGGYWLVAADGGVFTFGSAAFHGSLGGQGTAAPVVSLAAAPGGAGYWLATSAGEVRAFGSAQDHGSARGDGDAPASPIADLTTRRDGDGYWLATGGEATVHAASTGVATSYEPARPGEPTDADFDRLAQCESSGRWNLNSGNGYYGGLQFSASTWRSLGGTGLPHEHSREAQIDMGRRQWRQSGWQAWPSCRRTAHLG